MNTCMIECECVIECVVKTRDLISLIDCVLDTRCMTKVDAGEGSGVE